MSDAGYTRGRFVTKKKTRPAMVVDCSGWVEQAGEPGNDVSATDPVAALFDQKPPVLVEVRFPNLGTAPDWYLCHDEGELQPILERVGAGGEVRLTSVHDVTTPAASVVLRKPA